MLLAAAVLGPPGPQTGLAATDSVLVGAGDIASCAKSGDSATAKVLLDIAGTVFTVGDNAYELGTSWEFWNCYHPTWGQVLSRTRPSAGNHDYITSGAAGYFSYFGSRAGAKGKGYYAYDRGAWRIYVLNSNCWAIGGCGSTSPQGTWLKADLAANPRRCVLAYWHHPLFSSGEHGNQTFVRPLWKILYAARADVALNGHDHDYERFTRQSPWGVRTSGGIREFVVGTGGRSHYPFGTIQPNSQVRNGNTYGVLKLTLHATSYEWKFVPIAGKTFTDAGNTTCS